MNHQRSAEIQVVLEGISLPATRDQLVAYAALQDAEAAVELERIPGREYESLDEVGEELARTHPIPPAEAPLPRPESGDPPGGDDYLNPSPESGEARTHVPPGKPAAEVIEAQAATMKRQKAEQER